MEKAARAEALGDSSACAADAFALAIAQAVEAETAEVEAAVKEMREAVEGGNDSAVACPRIQKDCQHHLPRLLRAAAARLRPIALLSWVARPLAAASEEKLAWRKNRMA